MGLLHLDIQTSTNQSTTCRGSRQDSEISTVNKYNNTMRQER